RNLREDAVDVVDARLRLLRATDRGRHHGAVARPEADAREGLLDGGHAEAGTARGEIRRLALLPVPVAAVARPRPEGGIVHVAPAEVAIQDEVVALRVLSQLLAREPEHRPARVLELLRHLARDVVVGGEADLVLAVRLEMPRRHHELDAVAGSRRRQRLYRDRGRRRPARTEHAFTLPHPCTPPR